jgi:translation elongation factor Ts
MNFTAKDVAALREKTGCGMMDCKKALTEADGDFDKAIEVLREKGLAAQAKKAGRIAADGMVDVYIDQEKKIGVIIEVNSETDFVARNAEFKELVSGAAKAAAYNNPKNVEELLKCKFEDTDFTVEDILREKILKIGENMNIRRFERLEGELVSYVHGGGSAAAIALFETTNANEKFKEAGKNICMQIVAMTPAYLSKESVPADVVEHEKNILLAQIKNDPKFANKPEQVLEKMIAGKINKFYQETCLLEQAYVKEPKISVGHYLDQVSKEIGADIKLVKFVTYEKGEGLEKRTDDFADEVARMTK